MKVVVTGGAGFIGAHVVRHLCDAGHDVAVLDDLATGYENLVDVRAKFIRASFDDAFTLDRVLPDADAVVHLAASSIIKYAFERPAEYFQNNASRGVALLEAMRRHGVRQLVFASTAAVYGETQSDLVKEDHPKEPRHMYGASKLAFENVLAAYRYGFGISSTSFRFFNVYGPKDQQLPVTRAVPAWVRAAAAGDPLVVNWNGEQVRDYIYVEDVARAIGIAVFQRGLHRYNLGSGIPIRMRELAELIVRTTRSSSELVDGGPRVGDPMRLVADISLVCDELRWEPQMELEEGLKRTVASL